LIYEAPAAQHTAEHATNGYEIDITDLAAIKKFITKEISNI